MPVKRKSVSRLSDVEVRRAKKAMAKPTKKGKPGSRLSDVEVRRIKKAASKPTKKKKY